MRFTRTHTRFWGDDQLEPLRRCVAELRADGEEKMPFVDDDARGDMMRRIANLELAVGFMGDRAT